jgi:hypothetical protein
MYYFFLETNNNKHDNFDDTNYKNVRKLFNSAFIQFTAKS